MSRSGIIPIAHSAGHRRADGADRRRCRRAAQRSLRRRSARSATDEPPPADDDELPNHRWMSNGLRGARIGVARATFFGYSDVTDRIAIAAIERMKALGAVIVDPADIPNVGDYDASELEVLLYEFKADLNAYLGALGPSAQGPFAGRRHRVQRGQSRPGDAVLRSGADAAGAEERPADRQGLPDALAKMCGCRAKKESMR